MSKKSKKKNIMIFGILTLFLCLILMNQKSLAADITKISMIFPKTSLSVNQMSRAWIKFTLRNDHGQTLYYTKINSSKIASLSIEINPSEIAELEANMTPSVTLLVTANQTAINGSYQIKIWAESRDANWNNVKSPNYYINLTVFSNYTVINITSTTTSSTSTTVYATSTQKSFMNETFSKTIGKNITKNQVLIIVAVIMIILVIIPTVSFKKEPAEIITTKEETNH